MAPTPVNVVVSGLPHCGILCLKLGDLSHGVTTGDVHHAICAATGMPQTSMFLRAGTRLLLGPSDLICDAGAHTAFVRAGLRRALPGGKGGFGAQFRGASSKSGAAHTTNIDACRDLNGRRIGAVRRERAAAQALAHGQDDRLQTNENQNERDQQQQHDAVKSNHQRKRARSHHQLHQQLKEQSHSVLPIPIPPSSLSSSPLSPMHMHMHVNNTSSSIERTVLDAADHVGDAVREGLRLSGVLGADDPHTQTPVLTENNSAGADRQSKRRRMGQCSTNGVLSTLDAYGSCSSSSGEEDCTGTRAPADDESYGADEYMCDA